ncbi:hypothetical protein TNCV_1711521 [Trichonephila clavipes]|nr:hypothetical protein TNCV_1711521 [Trichonephila clavipes]
MPSDRQNQIAATRFFVARGYITFVVGHIMHLQNVLTPSRQNFDGEYLESGEESPLSSPTTNLSRRFSARQIFRVSPCRIGTIYLKAQMPSPGFKHRPYGGASQTFNTCDPIFNHNFHRTPSLRIITMY